jgi:hypothetical protein
MAITSGPSTKLLSTLVMIGSLAAVGCASTVEKVARQTTPAIVDEGVKKIADPQVQRTLVDSIDEELVEKAARRITAGVVDGTLDAFADGERNARVSKIADKFVLPLSIQTIEPQAITRAINAAMETALGPEGQAKMERFSAALSKALIAGFAEGAGEHLGPGVGDRINESLGKSAREMAKQATLGFQDAITEAEEKRKKGETDGSVLSFAGKAAEAGISGITLLAAIAVLAAVALGVALLVVVRRNRITAQPPRRRTRSSSRLTRRASARSWVAQHAR